MCIQSTDNYNITVFSQSITIQDVQVFSTFRLKIPVPVVFPLLYLLNRSPHIVSSLISARSIMLLQEPFTLRFFFTQFNEMMSICDCMIAGGNFKNYLLRGSLNTDNRTKSEEEATLLKFLKRPDSRVLQTYG